jgi:hypothetical protein
MHSFDGGLSGTDYAKTDVEHRHILNVSGKLPIIELMPKGFFGRSSIRAGKCVCIHFSFNEFPTSNPVISGVGK